jgi:hypothetical protein
VTLGTDGASCRGDGVGGGGDGGGGWGLGLLVAGTDYVCVPASVYPDWLAAILLSWYRCTLPKDWAAPGSSCSCRPGTSSASRLAVPGKTTAFRRQGILTVPGRLLTARMVRFLPGDVS